MVIFPRNSIDLNINIAILNVGVFNKNIKYLYVNIIWFFVIGSFIFSYIHVTNVFMFILILILPGAYMYITVKKNVSNIKTCYSPMEGEHIKSNDSLVRPSS